MGIRIIEKLKNQQGSSLAFVLIIGMVIMIMVASLLAVANSDFTFTQETVESRQAYIDAKSVIEFGKIEISNRKKELVLKNDQLKKLYDQYSEIKKNNPSQSTTVIEKSIADKINEIDDYMKSPFYIGYDDENNISETLEKIDDETNAIGVLKVSSTPNTEGVKYTYKIDTKNLRRDLDYKVDFDYVPSTKIETTGTGTGGSIITPVKPTYSTTPRSGISGKIYKNPDDSALNNTVSGYFIGLNGDKPKDEINKILDLYYPLNDLNICNGFTWVNGRTLNLTGQNILVTNQFATSEVDSDDPKSYFNMTAEGIKATTSKPEEPGEIYFAENYKQMNHGKNALTANGGDVVFRKGLEIGDKGTLVINCENLFVDGDITLKTVSSLYINAKNVVITGNIIVEGKDSKIYTNCENIWVGTDSSNSGKIKINNSSSTIDINDGFAAAYASNGWVDDSPHYNLNYFNCSDVSLVAYTTLNLKGSNGNNQITLGNITTADSGAEIKISNIQYLTTGDIHLGYQAKLTVTGISDKTSQMNSGVIRGNGTESDANYFKSEAYHELTVRITNLASFTCDSLGLDGNSTLKLNSNIIKINNYLSLSRMKNPIEITTQYMDVIGKTYIGNIQDTWTNGVKEEGVVKINAVQNNLNIRFNGGYEQLNSTVEINSAQLVMFGGSEFRLADGGADLYVQADNIYLASDLSYMANDGLFRYENNTSQTNVFVKTNIQTGTSSQRVLNAANYISKEKEGTLIPRYFNPDKGIPIPVWPSAPGGAANIIVNPGSVGNIGLEKYY